MLKREAAAAKDAAFKKTEYERRMAKLAEKKRAKQAAKAAAVGDAESIVTEHDRQREKDRPRRNSSLNAPIQFEERLVRKKKAGLVI